MKRLHTLAYALIIAIISSCTATKKDDTKQETVKIYLIGDSTCANKKENKYPECGWGMKLGDFFDNNVEIENHAQNGRSSRSFRGEGLWNEPILEKLQAGDYVFIQFGHNDQKIKSPDRYSNPFTGYRANLERYIEEARSKGAHPILLSSIVRRNFNEHGTLIDTHGEYPLVVRLVADAMNVPFIDLQRMTEELVIELGEEKSKELYLWLEANENINYPNGVEDNTHLNMYGGKTVAQMVINELSKQNILKSYMKK